MIGPLKFRRNRKARYRARYSEVAAKVEEARKQVYYRQNGVERLTPRQRRRVQHKTNAGRSA